MKVFVTGASGFVGSRIISELIKDGHDVTGLARSDEAAKAVEALGAQVHRGSLEDHESLRQGASESGGVIHCGFIHDFSKYMKSVKIDNEAIEIMGSALEGTNKPFVITSGTVLTGPGKLGREQDEIDEKLPTAARYSSEKTALAYARKGVRVSIIRLPPFVHGPGDRAFKAILVQRARDAKQSVYFSGHGNNRFSAVHVKDAVQLYVLALEKAEAGSVLHAAAEEGVTFREIAEAVGHRLDVPTLEISQEQGMERFGFLGMIFVMDCPCSSEHTRNQLGWNPTMPGLLEDIANLYD